jgi:hypothetical protein
MVWSASETSEWCVERSRFGTSRCNLRPQVDDPEVIGKEQGRTRSSAALTLDTRASIAGDSYTTVLPAHTWVTALGRRAYADAVKNLAVLCV